MVASFYGDKSSVISKRALFETLPSLPLSSRRRRLTLSIKTYLTIKVSKLGIYIEF
jgi:hypothetical protein